MRYYKSMLHPSHLELTCAGATAAILEAWGHKPKSQNQYAKDGRI